MSKDLKSVAFAETHNLHELIKLTEAGSFDIPADLYENVVLKNCDITPEQLKKKEKLDCELLAGVTYVAGEQVATAFKDNAELVEVGFSYGMGAGTASGVFSRDGADHVVVTVNTKHKTAEMKRVMDHCNNLFESINS